MVADMADIVIDLSIGMNLSGKYSAGRKEVVGRIAIVDRMVVAASRTDRAAVDKAEELGVADQKVGNDQKAREFLGRLDVDPDVGNLVDCTSSKSGTGLELCDIC